MTIKRFTDLPRIQQFSSLEAAQKLAARINDDVRFATITAIVCYETNQTTIKVYTRYSERFIDFVRHGDFTAELGE